MSATEKINNSSGYVLQWLFFLGLLATVFAIFTNFVPLIQLGWMEELGKKSRYTRIAIVAVSLFSISLIAVRVYSKAFFEKLLPIRLWNGVCAWPLFLTTTIFFLAYAGITTLVGFERHAALETRAFDLGIFAQAVWNTSQGKFLFSSIKENICLLGDHVSPILLLTVPFYKFWPDARVLVLLQSLAAAASFFPLAILAEKKLQNRSLTLVFLFMYFFFHSTRSALHEDFHPEVLAEHFLWWAFLFLEEKKIKGFIFFLILAAGGKENFLGITFALGFYAFVFKKLRFLGTGIMILSVATLFFEMKWVVPVLNPHGFHYTLNYHEMLTSPVSGFFARLFNLESLEYVAKIFLPFLYLPFFHISTLFLTFPILFQNLLSSSGGMRSFNYHYTTGMTPFLFAAAIYGLDSLRSKSTRLNKHIRWAGLVLLFMAVIRSGPSEYYFFWHIRSHRTVHTEMVRQKLKDFPKEGVVLTHNNLIPQVCNRERVYQFDYSPQNSKLDYARKYHADYVILDTFFWEKETLSVEETLQALQAGGYRIDFSQDGFFILKK